jgi:hypothetical protein
MKFIEKLLPVATPLFALLLLVGSSIAASTPQETPVQAEEAIELPTAREVVDRFVKVTGIDKFAPKYKSQHAVGTIEIVGMGVKGTTDMYSMKPGYMLMTVEMAMIGKVRTGDDGETAWRIHPMMGETILEGVELAQLRSRNTPYVSEFKKAENFEVMKTVGVEDFEGMRCYKLRFVDKPWKDVKKKPEETKELREFFEYYEVKTGLRVGLTSLSASPQGDMPSTTVLSDYKEFGELLVATKTLIKASSVKILATTTKLEFNTLEDAKVFALPLEIELLKEE